MPFPKTTRRQALSATALGLITPAAHLFTAHLFTSHLAASESDPPHEFRFLLASSLYGYAPVADVLQQVSATGAAAVDLWPKVHGNQREQVQAMGADAFADLLAQHQCTLGCVTQYPLGPFGLEQELAFAQRLGCHTIVTGCKGPTGLRGEELKSAIRAFVRQMRPHTDRAERAEVVIAIENHGNSLIESEDSLRWLAELAESPSLGVALAPYHLPQDAALIARLIRHLGSRLQLFYAWQHGQGCMQAQPKEQELLQMPGRGPLDFQPLVQALAEIRFTGWTEIFMHPYPRGVPIVEGTEQVTQEVNRARQYLLQCSRDLHDR